jgi:hypothetical protein
MKDVIDIFIINEEGLLELNKNEVRSIPAFREVIARDKGGKIFGDNEGRKKLFAYKELMYIHLVTHPSTIYRDLPKEAREIASKKLADLPEEWKPDKVINNAIEAYKELIPLSAVFHSYLNANSAVYALGEDLQFINQLREKTRNRIIEKTKELDGIVTEEDIQRINAEIDSATNRLMELGAKITTLSNSLPTAFETIEKLKVKLLNESSGGAAVYGGGTINNREK